MKKVLVSTIDTRKFVDALIHLGSVGGEFNNSCTAFKGMFLRAEVLVPETAVIEETPEMRVMQGLPKEVKKRVETEVKSEVQETTKVATKRATKTAKKVSVSEEGSQETSKD